MIYGENPQKDREHACMHKDCTQPDCAWRSLYERIEWETRMAAIARQLPGGGG